MLEMEDENTEQFGVLSIAGNIIPAQYFTFFYNMFSGKPGEGRRLNYTE